jgi:hypothetical protein
VALYRLYTFTRYISCDWCRHTACENKVGLFTFALPCCYAASSRAPSPRPCPRNCAARWRVHIVN